MDPIEQRKRERAANHAAEQAAKLAKEEAGRKNQASPSASTWPRSNAAYARRYGERTDTAVSTWRNPLVTHVYPVIGHLPLNDITVDHVVEIVRRAVEFADKLPTGERVQTRIGEVNWWSCGHRRWLARPGAWQSRRPARGQDGLSGQAPRRSPALPSRRRAQGRAVGVRRACPHAGEGRRHESARARRLAPDDRLRVSAERGAQRAGRSSTSRRTSGPFPQAA